MRAAGALLCVVQLLPCPHGADHGLSIGCAGAGTKRGESGRRRSRDWGHETPGTEGARPRGLGHGLMAPWPTVVWSRGGPSWDFHRATLDFAAEGRLSYNRCKSLPFESRVQAPANPTTVRFHQVAISSVRFGCSAHFTNPKPPEPSRHVVPFARSGARAFARAHAPTSCQPCVAAAVGTSAEPPTHRRSGAGDPNMAMEKEHSYGLWSARAGSLRLPPVTASCTRD